MSCLSLTLALAATVAGAGAPGPAAARAHTALAHTAPAYSLAAQTQPADTARADTARADMARADTVRADTAHAGMAPVIVASKPFAESYILAEAFAQLLEAHGYPVERRLGLGATKISFGALRTGAIDVYPEYTGTGLVAILHEPPSSDARAVFRRVSREFHRRWGVRWLPPLGFQNTYAIAVRPQTARADDLRTLSDLARVAPRLTAGFSPDFIGRADGLPGLRRTYDLHFKHVRSLLQAVKYQALASGDVDVIDGYSTDGEIARYHLVVLRDDRHFFPAYQAAALVSRRVAEHRPGVISVLSQLSGRIDAGLMRRMNRRVEVDGASIPRVAAALLDSVGLGHRTARALATSPRSALTVPGLARYLWRRRATLLGLTRRHLLLVGISLLAAILVAVPLGLGLERFRGSAETTIRAVGLLQTVPGIALIAFMIPLLGIGVLPALVALFLYSLYPIVRNTYSGVRDAGPEAVDAARALGMTPLQVLRYVRLPLAAPVIMAGIRTAAVIDVGTATLAAFIGAGGLGDPIVAGLALSDTRMVLSGAIPAALLALVVDGVLAGAETLVTPRTHGAIRSDPPHAQQGIAPPR